MKIFIALIITIISITGCVGGGQSYVTSVNRDNDFRFEIIAPPLGSVTLPGDAKSWVDVGTQAGWHSFKNQNNNDSVQYVNLEKNNWDFYSTDLSTNKKFMNKYYVWESEYLSSHNLVERTEVIEKEVNEDKEDYILIEVLRNDNRKHFIVFSIQNGRVIGVALRSDDTRDMALSKVTKIYESTKY